MSWSGWYLRNSSISAILRSVIGVVTPFRLLVVLLLEGNAPVTFSVNHRPDSTGFYTLPGTLTCRFDGIRRRRLRQCDGREFLRYAEDRTSRQAEMDDTDATSSRYLRLHRGVL